MWRFLLLSLLVLGCSNVQNKNKVVVGGYMEYSMSFQGKATMLVKTYYSNGNTRTESSLLNSDTGDTAKSVTLFRRDEPDVLYMLNTTDGTYTKKNSANESLLQQMGVSEITIVGGETINGYKSTHFLVKSNPNNFDVPVYMDLWISKDVPDYKFYDGVGYQFINYKSFSDMLKAKGGTGILVKMALHALNNNFEVDLMKIKKQDLSPSLFRLQGHEIPSTPSYQDVYKSMQNLSH